MQESHFHTSFSKETWDSFKSDQRPGPIDMLNLIRLRDKALYSDGTQSSGEEAFQRYSDISQPIFERLGGRIVWRGTFELTMVGPDNETWDLAFIAQYPSVEAFVSLMKDATYRQAMAHRQAGALDSRLIRLNPSSTGNSFAG